MTLDEVIKLTRKNAWFLKTGYEPHPAQQQIHDTLSRFIVAVCGRRFGKSLLAAKEAEVRLVQPNKRIWVVAPTYDLTDKVFREVWKTFVIDHRGIDIAKKSEHEHYIRFKNGSEIIGKSADNPDSLIGEGVDYLIIDEAAKIKRIIWEKYLRPTLSDKTRDGEALFITTPEGTNWFYKLYRLGKNDKYPDWRSFRCPTSSNPHIKPEEIEFARQTLTNEIFMQEYLAEFATFAGKVYKEFNHDVHVIDVTKMPLEFSEVFTALDFGFVNETAILVIGVNDSRFYVLDEIYRAGLNESDTVTCYNDLKKKHPKIKYGYGDHDQSKLNALNNASAGIMMALKSNVADGIQTVAEQMKLKSDGKPGLFIARHCENLITEIENYRYAEQHGNTNTREEPLKLKDHAVDALRYGLHSKLKAFVPKTFKGRGIGF